MEIFSHKLVLKISFQKLGEHGVNLVFTMHSGFKVGSQQNTAYFTILLTNFIQNRFYIVSNKRKYFRVWLPEGL